MKNIPYGRQYIDERDIQEVVKVLRSDYITQGPRIKEFEDALCRYAGAKYAVAVSSGTAALHVACLAAGIGEGDEVITSPITFVASANCVLYCGGKPVFADIRGDGNIDPASIERNISKKTKALIPVHFAGYPCDLKNIKAIARKRGLVIIEDACHALGAKYHDSMIGSCDHSDMAVFSFHPVKSITTAEGGAVLTNSKESYKKLLALRSHGITKEGFLNEPAGGWYYEMQYLGFNYRMTDLQAALGISQLKKLNNFISRRRAIASKYREAFYGNPYFDIPVEGKGIKSSYHLYPIRLKGKLIPKRKQIFSALRDAGLGVQVHYIPVYAQPYYRHKGYKKTSCPAAEKFYKRIISIPLYPGMTDRQADSVINIVLNTCKKV